MTFAAQHERILITHNADDYELLQRAWRLWTDVWLVQPKPIHAGILAVPQPPSVTITRLAREIDAFLRTGTRLSNRFYKWTPGRGWTRYG